MRKKLNLIIGGCTSCPYSEQYEDYHARDIWHCDHDDAPDEYVRVNRDFFGYPPEKCPLPDYFGELPDEDDGQGVRILDLGAYSV